MSRWHLLGLLCVAFFMLGLLTTWTSGSSTVLAKDDWQELGIPDKSWRQGAIERMVASGRWEIDAPEPIEEPSGPTGEFSKDYSLVGIVSSVKPYALLQARHGNPINEVLRVEVGDVLDNDWAILEITDVAVVAKRKEETQRVELFSRT